MSQHDVVEMFCNRSPRHSHLGAVTPETFERASCRGSGVSTIRGEVHSTHCGRRMAFSFLLSLSPYIGLSDRSIPLIALSQNLHLADL